MSLCRTPWTDWHTQPACTVLEVDGVRMIGTNPRNGYGVTRLDGWDTGGEHAGGAVPYESADGGLEGQVVRNGRQITIEGVIIAHDKYDLAAKRETLGGILTGDRWGDLVVSEDWLGLERQVRVTRRSIQITPTSHRRAVFTLQLETASAVRVDAGETVLPLKPGASGTAANIGTLPAALTVALRGPLTKPSITLGGLTWRYEANVASGQVLWVDMTRRIVRDPATTTWSRRWAFGSWLTVPAGATPLTIGGSGSGTVELRWRSTWH